MIEIMDTTLRDGEQTSGVSFAAHEKLSIAQVLLNDLGVNRVEIASARVSDGEFEAVKRVAAWAARSGNLDKLEVFARALISMSPNSFERLPSNTLTIFVRSYWKRRNGRST